MQTHDMTQTQNYPATISSDPPSASENKRWRQGKSTNLSTGLGWFSVGLGLAELVAPRVLSKCIGVPSRPAVMRLMGVRELIAGIGILTTPRPTGWMWARVAGDVMDLAVLARGAASPDASAVRSMAALAAVAGVTVLDAGCAQHFSSQRASAKAGPWRFTAAVSINRSPEECYRFWNDIERLPSFIDHLRSVRVTSDGRSHWIAKGQGGNDLSWDAEIVENIPNEIIAWRSLDGSEFPNSGRVRFEPSRGGRTTIVRILLEYRIPKAPGKAVFQVLTSGDPRSRVRKDLLRFKQLIETGEVATTEGQPAGRPSSITWLDRMARI